VLLALAVLLPLLYILVNANPSARVSYTHHAAPWQERLTTKINIKDDGARSLYDKFRNTFPEKNLFAGENVTFDCDACIVFMQQIQILAQQNATFGALEEIFTDICMLLVKEKRVVCAGLSSEFGPEIQEIFLSDPDLQPEYICQHLLICPTTFYSPPKPKQTLPKTPITINSQPNKLAPNSTRFFIHITDVHHDPQYQEGTNTDCGLPLCCRATDGPGTARKFGEYNCDANVALLSSMESYINTNTTFNSRFGNSIDFMIWTGDNPPHDIWAETRDSQLNASSTVASWLYNSFTLKRNWPIFPAIGNHESFPVDQFPGPPRNSWLMEPTAQYWSRWLGKSQLDTVRQGAFYMQQIPNTKHYIMAFNTMYCDINNFWMVLNDTDPADQIAWMTQSLEAVSKINGSGVYLIGHIPLHSAGCLYNYSSRIGQVIRSYSARGVIKGSFFGHTHDDGYFVFKEGSWNGSRPVSVGWVAPSVTPFTYLNPSFRVFEYDPETFEIVDYHQYNMDLNSSWSTGTAEWKLYYSAKQAYGLKDMSAQSWTDLVKVFEKDDALFQQWNRRHYSGYFGTGTCEGGCKNSTLCGFEASTFKDLFECTGQEYSLNNLWPYIINHIM